jgi:nitroreductase
MCRNFQQKPVEMDKLKQLVYAANRAPQGGNMPVREYILIDNPRYLRLLRDVTPSFLANATAAIVVITDLEKAEKTMGVQGRDILSLLDAGAAAENMALMAVELGLGASFVRSSTEKAAKYMLDIPDKYRLDIIVGFGYKDPQRPPPMKGFIPVVHHNRFGIELK